MGETNANVDGNTADDEDQDNVDRFPSHLSQNTSSRAPQAGQQSIKPKSWSISEDEALISAYMEVSTNSIVDTNQRTGALWSRIKRVYDELCRSNTNMAMRVTDSLKGRWRRIAPSVMKWTACYDEALQQKKNGYNDEDVIREAHNIYERTFGSKFVILHAWVILRRFPKWESIVQPSLMSVPRGRPLRCQREETDSSPQIESSSKRKSTDDFIGHSTPTNEWSSQPFFRPERVKKAKKTGKAPIQDQGADRIYELCAKLEYSSKVREEYMNHEEQRAKRAERKLKIKQDTRKLEMIIVLLKNPNRTEFEDQMLTKMVDWAETNGLM